MYIWWWWSHIWRMTKHQFIEHRKFVYFYTHTHITDTNDHATIIKLFILNSSRIIIIKIHFLRTKKIKIKIKSLSNTLPPNFGNDLSLFDSFSLSLSLLLWSHSMINHTTFMMRMSYIYIDQSFHEIASYLRDGNKNSTTKKWSYAICKYIYICFSTDHTKTSTYII